jgi:hypothetical protein
MVVRDLDAGCVVGHGMLTLLHAGPIPGTDLRHA